MRLSTGFRQLATCTALLLLTISAVQAPCFSQRAASIAGLSDVSIPRFDVVCPNLYRGSQPSAQDLQQLKKAGVAVDVCLDDESKYLVPESLAAQAVGITFVSIPMSALHGPTKKDIARFLEVVSHKDQQPVYVHCVHGRDRTSAMVGIYRVSHDGWTADAAYNEMLNHGFRPFFIALSNAVFDAAAQLGIMSSHRSPVGFITGHMAGTRAR